MKKLNILGSNICTCYSDDSVPLFSGIPLFWIHDSDTRERFPIFCRFLLLQQSFSVFVRMGKVGFIIPVLNLWNVWFVCLACTIIAYTIKPLTDRDSINNMAWRFPKPGQDVIVIDKTVKNPWNIGSDYHATLITEKRSKYDRKITEPCTATCVLCNED